MGITWLCPTNQRYRTNQCDRHRQPLRSRDLSNKGCPRPFVITDLNQSVQGTLDVKITEEDGRTNTFQVSAASTPFLTREGQVRYKIAAGRARPDISHHVIDETFASGEASWGILSNTSLYGGILAGGSDYRSAALGIGQNMLWLGALSFDVTRASSTFDDGHQENGLSYRLNYSKRFDATNSQISLAAYRFSEREFHSYANFIAHQYNNADTQDEKQTVSIAFNQPIDPLRMNLYVSALRQQWWDGDSSTTASVTAGFNFDVGEWKGLSLSTSFSTTHYEESDNDKQVYVSLSVPFDFGRRLNYDMRNSSNTTNTLSWNDSSDPRNTRAFPQEPPPTSQIMARNSGATTSILPLRANYSSPEAMLPATTPLSAPVGAVQ